MKIADIGLGKAVLEELIDKKKTQKMNASSALTRMDNNKDSFENGKRITPDLARMNELQKSYLKDNASLKGLLDLRQRTDEFNVKTGNYDKLSQELNAIVTGTRFQGESIISYLSTHISDEKALYTFKANLNTEIDNVRLKVSGERKDIASYLVREENLEGMKGYFADQSAKIVASFLNAGNVDAVHRKVSNINVLLGMEK